MALFFIIYVVIIIRYGVYSYFCFQMMQTIQKCIICSEELSFSKEVKDHFLSGEIFNLKYCSKCDVAYTDPIPDDSVLPNYYNSEKYYSHAGKQRSFFHLVYNFIRKLMFRKKYQIICKYKKQGDILDIGCGTGALLEYIAQKKGWNAFGIEPNEIAFNSISNKDNISIYLSDKDEALSTKKFDFISMWHVLEHVTEIDDRLTYIKNNLKKDGVLLIAVPNKNSFDARYYKDYWAGYDVPRHLYHFSHQSVALLLRQYGFELTHIHPLVFDSYYVSLLSESYLGRSKIIALFCATIVGTISNILSVFNNKNYSSNIYIFKKI